MVQVTMWLLPSEQTAKVRALSSLTRRDTAAVRAAVRAAGNLYRVEEHDDYDGYLSVLVTPPPEGRAAFLVSGRTGAVDLAALLGDEMVPLGCYPSIGAAMSALRPALERGGSGSPIEEARCLIDRHGGDADIPAAMRADADGGDRWRAVIRAIDARENR